MLMELTEKGNCQPVSNRVQRNCAYFRMSYSQIENVGICDKGTMPLCSEAPSVQKCGDLSTLSKAYC